MIDDKEVVAEPAFHQVDTGAAINRVVAGITRQIVRTSTADDRIIAQAAIGGVRLRYRHRSYRRRLRRR
ncbi:hypothetical protein LP421_17235 [Rhizobium sp. RCAM05350]|nr:hypothetical protein LP421_17235 [Rhizobium sp. RCAM05350]